MEHDQQLRNLRDFLLVYNRMTETCFQRCTTNFNYRHLTMDEEHCVDSCAGKLIRSNHRLMGTYVRLMPGMVQRRMEELESKAAEAAKAAEGATAVEPQSLSSSSVLPPPPHPAEMPPAVPPVPDVMTPSAPMPVIEPFVPSNAERVGTDAEIPAVPPLATLGTPQALEATPTMPTILAPSTNGSPQTAPAILETVTKLAEADGPPVQSFSSDAIQPMPLPPVMDRPPVFLDQSPQLSSVAPTVAETSVTNSYPVLSPPTVSVAQQPADHASIAEPVHLTPAHPSNSSVSVSDMSKAVAAMPIEKLALPKQSDQASTTVTTTSQSAVVMGQDSQPPS